MKKNKTFYITTPIFYPSGKLHIGHFYTMSLAGVFANYKKMMGYDVLFLTGADEHGKKIAIKAQEQNIAPQKYVDKMSDEFIKLWKMLDFKYDIYMRTSFSWHHEAVRKIFTALYQKKYIYKDNYQGLYSVQDEEFFTKSQAILKDNNYYSPVSGHKLETISEESYFFQMNLFQSFLQQYFRENPDLIKPKKIVKELENNFLSRGLENLSISRINIDWGISVKEDSRHTIYVWIDALSNYITALNFWQKDDSLFQKFWKNGDEIVHIVGKEITRFHCIYWPIILKALNLRLPTKIFSHGWIITKSGKMSKSKGNVIDPLVESQKYSAEVLKYYLFSQIKTGEDGSYNEDSLKTCYNAELANTFGNLVSRTIGLSLKNFGTSAPKFRASTNKEDQQIYLAIEKVFQEYCQLMDDFDVFVAIKTIMRLCRALNLYIDETTPWKKTANDQHLAIIINYLLNGIYVIGLMLKPILPKKILQLEKQLGLNIEKEKLANWNKFDQAKLSKNQNLFPRL